MKAGFLLGGDDKGKEKEMPSTTSKKSPSSSTVGYNKLPVRKPKTSPQSSFLSVEARCRRRLESQTQQEQDERNNRVLTLGEQVIRNPLIRSGILKHFNPWKRSDLQYVLELRCFYGVLPDIDLKECCFQTCNADEFMLANWEKMSIGEVRQRLVGLHRMLIGGKCQSKADFTHMESKKAIVASHRELLYLPWRAWVSAINGGRVLHMVEAGTITGGFEGGLGSSDLLQSACSAGLDVSVIREVASKTKSRDQSHMQAFFASMGLPAQGGVNQAMSVAAITGHVEVLDLLADEFDGVVDDNCFLKAVAGGQIEMIDHLVERYGMDPNATMVTGQGEEVSALAWAVGHGRVHIVRHLIDTYGVDFHAAQAGSAIGAVEWASLSGQTAVVDLLAKEYDASVGVLCLHLATKVGQIAMIDHLVANYGLDPDARDKDGYTALHWAAWHDNAETVEHLLTKYKVDPKKKVGGFTALDMAESSEVGSGRSAAVLRKYKHKTAR